MLCQVSIDSFQRYWWSKNPGIQLDQGTPGLTQPKVVVSDVTFPWWLMPCKKN